MIVVTDATHRYGSVEALRGVSLRVDPGQRVVILGTNGSGKSTLARLLNGSLLPSSGSVEVDGVSSSPETTRRLAELVGYVRQDPRNQIVSPVVSDEVAFGPRNLGLSRPDVLSRVDEALEVCGISHLRHHMTTELSGGQQQLLALAGVLAMRPRYLVLDEACSQLDEATRRRVRAIVRDCRERGVGVVEVAHFAEDVAGADRVLVLERGRLAWEGEPGGFFLSPGALASSGLRDDPLSPVLSSLAASGCVLTEPLDEKDVVQRLGVSGAPSDRLTAPSPAADEADEAPAAHELCLRDASLSYGDTTALVRVSLSATGVTLLLGASGSGKSTAARLLSGVLAPDDGSAELDGGRVRAGRVGLAFQRPEDQLFSDTVIDDIAYGPRMAGHGDEAARAEAIDAARRLGVGSDLLGRSPFELSGGQMRRVALAGVIAAGPSAYVFDEPTAGLDAPSRREVRELVSDLAAGGAPVVVITHDAAEWIDVARRVVFLAGGRVTGDLRASEVRANPAPFEAAGMLAPLMVRLRAAGRGGEADA